MQSPESGRSPRLRFDATARHDCFAIRPDRDAAAVGDDRLVGVGDPRAHRAGGLRAAGRLPGTDVRRALRRRGLRRQLVLPLSWPPRWPLPATAPVCPATAAGAWLLDDLRLRQQPTRGAVDQCRGRDVHDPAAVVDRPQLVQPVVRIDGGGAVRRSATCMWPSAAPC